MNFLIIVICFLLNGVSAQNEDSVKPKEVYYKNFFWHEDVDGHKKGDPMLKTRIYYFKDTSVKQREENFGFDGVMKSISYFRKGVLCKKESLYSTTVTLKGRRDSLMKEKTYYYNSDCFCVETIEGQKESLSKTFYGGQCSAISASSPADSKDCPSIEDCPSL